MNRPELFVKSVDILVDAYNKGKLRHLTACNCAVGNLIAYRKGSYTKVDETWIGLISDMRKSHLRINESCDSIEKIKPTITASVDTIYGGCVEGCESVYDQSVYTKDMLKDGLNEIKETEYTLDEIEKIERAFEEVSPISGLYEPINGTVRGRHADNDSMMRVIKVLGEIHEIPKDTVKCMQDHVKNGTYKLSYKLKKPKKNTETTCPVVGTVDSQGRPKRK